MLQSFQRLVLLSALASLGVVPAAHAQTAAPDVRDLRGRLQAKSMARDDARTQAADLREEVARLDKQLAELRAVAASGEKGLTQKRERLAELNARETSLRTDMGRNQTQLADLLGALELYRREPPPALLVTPKSAKDAVRAAILIRAAAPELAARAAAFKAKAEELTRVRRTITSVSEDLFTSESALAEGRAGIEHAIREKQALQRQLDADAQASDRDARALALQLQALGAATTANPRLYTTVVPSEAPAAFAAPADGQMIRRFGQPSPGGQASDGVTWRTAAGAQVRAPAAGVVEYSGPLKGWGGVLILNVGGGYHLVLAGLDRIETAAGRQVTGGQALGAMAAAGRAAPELYMEVRKDGAAQNPARWLRSATTAGRG